MSNETEHVPVLLQEAVDALVTSPSGCYVDATFGRGGHSREILKRLDGTGRLIALDRDDSAVTTAQALESEDTRFAVFKRNFDQLEELMNIKNVQGQLDGLLLDLGVSSPQLDVAERGFSFSADGPLDMRMDQGAGLTARDWLMQVEESELAQVIKDYGEERYARRIARAIVDARDTRPFESTAELAELVRQAHPRWERSRHPATRTFQAIRIQVNNELGALGSVLLQARNALKQGGRLVVISFHSLEDRLVKREMSGKATGQQSRSGKQKKGGGELFRERRLLANLPQQGDAPKYWKVLGKAVYAGEAELARNPRARSAVMRVAERQEVGVSGAVSGSAI